MILWGPPGVGKTTLARLMADAFDLAYISISAVLSGVKEIREAVDASLDANVRTPEIQVEGGAKYGTKEVGGWIVDYIKRK